MKKIIRKLAAVVMIATMVTPVFAADLRLKQNPVPAHADNQWVGYDLVDGQAIGQRTVHDIIIKDGTTFVNAEEFAQAMDLYLHEETWRNTKDSYVLTTKILKSDPSYSYRVELCFAVGDKKFTLTGVELTQVLIKGEYYEGEKPMFTDHYLPGKVYEWSKYGDGDDEVSDITCQGAFATTAVPFKKDGKIYVPIRTMVQVLNNDLQTKMAYNAVEKSVTFQKDFMYKHYLCNGIIGTYKEQ